MIKILYSLVGLSLVGSVYANTLSSSLEENTLVVYNQNMGLVHEKRALSLDKGRQFLIYPNVASTVVTDSVNVSFPSKVTLFSQKYKYDKITLSKLLDAHIDKKVEVKIWTSRDTFVYKKGTLLSNGSQVLLRLKDGKIVQASSSDIKFTSIPKTLVTKPSLLWELRAKEKVKGSLSLDYIINNISWKSDYVLKIDKNSADLSGWITLSNNSGKAFEKVSLKVLAGDVTRQKAPNRAYKRNAQNFAMMDSVAEVQEVSHEGYHIYSIPFKVDLANNEKTQIEFINEKNIKIQRRYRVKLSPPQWFRGEKKNKVEQYIEFKNLSKPLPKGTMRTYSSLEGATILLGVNQIPHTAKKEKTSLPIGKNFDLSVKETNVFLNESKRSYESEIKYTITNRSNTSKKIELLVPFQKHSSLESIVQSKIKFTYKNGHTLKFDVYVKADAIYEFSVKYRNKR